MGLRVVPEHERCVRQADPQAKGKPIRATVSDLWIPHNEHPKPVEVELTQKAESRYKELWGNFRDRYPYGSQVLYLVGWPGGVDALLRLTDKFENSAGWLIYVASLKAFRESLGRCAFVNQSHAWRRTVCLAAPASRPLPSAPAAAATPAAGVPVIASEVLRA